MKRIYLADVSEEVIEIHDSAHHYLKNVLRLTPGADIEILTPSKLITARITDIDKKRTLLQTIEQRDIKSFDYSFTVYQCILKREYMDNVVEKYTELGVTKIVPVVSERSVQMLKDSTLRRYKEISVAASLQSEREELPEIAEAIKLEHITSLRNACNLLFYGRQQDKAIPSISSKNIKIVIGPEGGFTENEVNLLSSKGFNVVSPLRQILKAETAAVVFAGWVQIELGKTE